jgi:hypothetical protein
MKAREALIVWNDQEVKVTKLGSRDDEERFPNSGGAAYEYWQEATNFDRLLLHMFRVLTVEFRIDPRVVDDAFCAIDEYDKASSDPFDQQVGDPRKRKKRKHTSSRRATA